MRLLLLLVLFLLNTTVFAQISWQINTSIGTSIMEDLDEYREKHLLTSSLSFGIGIHVYKKLKLNTGLGIQANQAEGTYRSSEYCIHNIRPLAYLLVDLELKQAFHLASGLAFSFYRDFKHIDKTRHDNFQTNLVLMPSYYINNRWSISLIYQTNIQPLADVYFLSVPKQALSVGLQYHLK